MTVSTTTNKVFYTGNGVATSFAIPFPFLNDTHLKVLQLLNDIQTQRTDWTLSGGNLVFATAPANGAQIVIMREVPLTQETDYRENEILPAETLERSFDKLTMQMQQLKEENERSVKVDMFSDADPSSIINEIEVLYNHKDDIIAVVESISNVNTVSADLANVDITATNMTAIQAAPTEANNAATSAALAQNWATKMDGQVDGTEYSSKYYAGQAAISAAGSKFKLFQHQWFDYALDDMAWLRADTFSWQDGTVYSNAYNHLVNDIDGVSASTETVGGYTVTFYRATDGHKIVLADQETTVGNIYTATGVAWYYVLDVTNERFKLPRINPSKEELELLTVPTTAPVKGNGKVLGLTNGTNTGLVGCVSGTSFFTGGSSAYGADIGSTYTATGVVNGKGYGVTSDGTKSGVVADLSGITKTYFDAGNKYLYFYVGQYTQAAVEQTAGLNAELFSGKADVDLTNAATSASASAKQEMFKWDTPDYSAKVDNTSAWGTELTAPSNGFVWYRSNDSANNGTATLIIGTAQFNVVNNSNTSGVGAGCMFRILKNQTYTASGGNGYSRALYFFPAIGG